MVAPNLLKWASRFDSTSKKYHWDTIKKPNYENRKPQVVSPLVSSAVQENQNKPWEHTELHFLRPTVLKRSDCWLFSVPLHGPQHHPAFQSITISVPSFTVPHTKEFFSFLCFWQPCPAAEPPSSLAHRQQGGTSPDLHPGAIRVNHVRRRRSGSSEVSLVPLRSHSKGAALLSCLAPNPSLVSTSICPSPPWPLVHTSHLPVKKSAEGKGSSGWTHRGFHTGDLKLL